MRFWPGERQAYGYSHGHRDNSPGNRDREIAMTQTEYLPCAVHVVTAQSISPADGVALLRALGDASASLTFRDAELDGARSGLAVEYRTASQCRAALMLATLRARHAVNPRHRTASTI